MMTFITKNERQNSGELIQAFELQGDQHRLLTVGGKLHTVKEINGQWREVGGSMSAVGIGIAIALS